MGLITGQGKMVPPGVVHNPGASSTFPANVSRPTLPSQVPANLPGPIAPPLDAKSDAVLGIGSIRDGLNATISYLRQSARQGFLPQGPQNVRVTPNSTFGNVVLRWDDEPSGCTPAFYSVWRQLATTDGTTINPVNFANAIRIAKTPAQPAGSPGSTLFPSGSYNTYTDSDYDLANNNTTAYYYWVTTIDNFGNESIPNAVNTAFFPPGVTINELNVNTNLTVSGGFDISNSVYSVKYFGAKGDGTTDDTTAIQTTITTVGSVGGGIVFFPTGTYKITSALSITSNSVYLAGVGNGTIIKYTPTTGDAIDFTGVTYCGISNTIVQGSTVATTGALIKFSNCASYRVDNVFTGFGWDALVVSTGNTGVITEFNAASPVHRGIYLSQTTNPYATNCLVTSAGSNGYDMDGVSGGYFTQIQSYNAGGSGIFLEKSGAATNNYLFFTNCIMDTSTTYNWFISVCQYVFLDNCWGSTGSASSSAGQSGYLFNANAVDVYLSNCIALNNKLAGYELFGATPTRIHFSNCLAVANNVGNTAAIGGFRCPVGTGITIKGCRAYNAGAGNQQYGIALTGTVDNFNVEGNNVLGNATAGMLVSMGTSVGQFVKNNLGWNPQTTVTQPAVALTTVAVNNTTGVDCMVYVLGGTVTVVKVGGVTTGLASNTGYMVPVGSNIAITYTGAPTWVWIGS